MVAVILHLVFPRSSHARVQDPARVEIASDIHCTSGSAVQSRQLLDCNLPRGNRLWTRWLVRHVLCARRPYRPLHRRYQPRQRVTPKQSHALGYPTLLSSEPGNPLPLGRSSESLLVHSSLVTALRPVVPRATSAVGRPHVTHARPVRYSISSFDFVLRSPALPRPESRSAPPDQFATSWNRRSLVASHGPPSACLARVSCCA